MWFFKKEKALQPKILKIKVENRLSIKLECGILRSYSYYDWQGKKKTEPWANFLKWYYGRKSDAYMMTTMSGADMILRSQIVFFEIEIINSYEEM